MNTYSKISAEYRDEAKYDALGNLSDQELLVYASRKSGLSVVKIMLDFRHMAKSQGHLTLAEYVRYGLYNPDRFSAEERARFVSAKLHWPVTHTCNNNGWSGAAEDKILAATLLGAGGVPVPESLAVVDRSRRAYPGLPTISTAQDLRDLVLAHSDGRLFGKIVDGMVSFGTFRVEHGDTDHIHCSGQEPMSYDRFITEFMGDKAYVIQRNLTNHADIARFSSALATVRMINLVTDDGVKCPFALIKLPQGDNIADNFWRPGNLACDIDPDTGCIRTVAHQGTEMEFFDDHPTLPGLMGLRLPFWSELRAVNERAARIFAPIRYQSTDIAITETGPVVVELNYGGAFELPQSASGRGLLTPEVRGFFESCGFDFDAKPKMSLPFFGR